jgi:DNA repair protein RadC
MGELSTYQGHQKRLAERFKLSEAKGLLDYELMELLLTFSIPRRDVKPIAKKLITGYHGISGVLDAPEWELRQIKGIGERSVTLIHLVKQFCTWYHEDKLMKRDVLTDQDLVVKFCQVRISGRRNEVFMIIYLNSKNEVLGHEVILEGTINNIMIYPRLVIEKALRHNAAGCILVHNHPSGHTQPSRDDREITRRLKECLKMIDVNLLDHIIVSKQEYFSFFREGML